MKKLPDIAINECVRELRAACRLPIDQSALDIVVGWLRPNFERILGHPEGARRWADHGQRMRDNARHLGGLADFFASHADAKTIGDVELKRALQVIRADCTVRAERTPVAFEYCTGLPMDVDARAAEKFLAELV
jgi:hypothetical protein